MKTLILSCNTGEGHNSCAKAIKEYYDSKGCACDIKDGLEFISPSISNFISRGHSFIYCHIPWLFKWGYGHFEKHPSYFADGSAIYRFFARGTERMYQYICSEGYDAVICVHVFTALMITDVLKKHPMDLKTCFVATDYTCSPSTKDSKLDYYFIPDEKLRFDFICDNIPEEKMISSGIPIRQMFYVDVDKPEAKARIGIPSHHKHLLIMCGSMGCGPIKKILRKLSGSLPRDWELTVICGRNEKLYKKLKIKYAHYEKIHVKGFVKDMGTMMDSADLYLTKPGGISVSEASIKNVPMVFIDAVAGCEKYNGQFFADFNCAQTCASVSDIAKTCISIMQKEEKCIAMGHELQKLKKGNSARVIYETMDKYETCRYE